MRGCAPAARSHCSGAQKSDGAWARHFFWGPPVCHISHALLSRRPDPAEAGDYRHLIINTFFYLFTFVLEKYYFVVNPDVRTLIKATKINLDEALGWLSRNIQGLDPADTCN